MPKKDQENEPRSKRRYPERICANAACEYEKKFIPHDRRQRFCSAQCRIDYHNDARHTTNNTDLLNEKLLRRFDKKLKKIYQNCLDAKGVCMVLKEILAYEQIDLRLSVSELDISLKLTTFFYWRLTTPNRLEFSGSFSG